MIVYCEGGPSVSVDDIDLSAESGTLSEFGSDNTVDVLFWEAVFSSTPFPGRFHFKSIGSRSLLLAILSDVIENSIDTVVFCVDRDYTMDSAFVERAIVTYGYSFENDICAPEIVTSFLRRYIGRSPSLEPYVREFIAHRERFLSDLLRWIDIDRCLVLRGKKGIFDRKTPMKYIEIATGTPCLNSEVLRRELAARGFKRGPRIAKRTSIESAHIDVVGKIIARFTYHFVSKIVRKRLVAKLEYESFVRSLSAEMEMLIRSGALIDLRQHYFSQISKLPRPARG